MEEKSKKEHQQPLVVILNLARRFWSDWAFRRLGQFELIVERQAGRRLGLHRQLLKFENRDFLRFAIFENREVVLA